MVAKKSEPKKDSKKDVKKKDSKKMKFNFWKIVSIVLIVALLALFIVGVSTRVSKSKAEDIVLKFAESQGADVEVVKTVRESGVYKVIVSYQGSEMPIYITCDGKNLVSGLVPFEQIFAQAQAPAASEPEPVEVPKSDKPTAELFIMTHCPYGTQAEKGFIPAMNLLKDSADVEIRYVHYFMHQPEYNETPRQICIREELGDDVFLDYLTCFLEGDGVADSSGIIRNGNDPSTCMAEVGINEAEVIECVESGDWETYYEGDSSLSQSYGVQGSPTLVINGQIVSSSRDAESYKNTICSAFNNVPGVCDETLDSTSPSVYFGWDFSKAPSSSGSC